MVGGGLLVFGLDRFMRRKIRSYILEWNGRCASVGEDMEVALRRRLVTKESEARRETDAPTAKRTNGKQATKQAFGNACIFQRRT